MNHRMMILSTAGLLLAVSSCQLQQSKAASFSDADRAAVKAVFDSTVARVNRKDFAAWANEYTEDGVLMPPNHPTVKGRTSIKAWGDSLPPITSFAFNDVTADGDGDVGYGTSSYALTFSPPRVAATNDRGKQLVTFHRQSDGSWLVTAASFNSDIPLPAAPPPSPASAKK